MNQGPLSETAQLDLGLADLPTVRLRVSARARRPSISISVHDGIVIAIPRDFDQRRVPRLIAEWRPWIEQQLRTLDRRRRALPPGTLDPLPSRIRLEAVGRAWDVDYQVRPWRRARLGENTSGLIVSGPTGDVAACRAVLRRWLAERARAFLAPWLATLGERHGLSYRRLAIRGQRTRWGSYSSNGTISLNYQLMFLAPELVRCVLLHELCHTRWMGHGPRFYSLLSRLEPDHQALDQRINDAWETIPAWVQQR
jgi:predicted metal-dependent hydrolase